MGSRIRLTTEVTCANCGIKFEKENRSFKKNIVNHYCSLKCTGIAKTNNANPLAYNANVAKKNAKVKNLEFNLTPEFLWELYLKQDKKCAVTGVDIIPVHKNSKNLYQISIDRIDNSKGYVTNNVHLVALGINYMRNTMELEDVILFLNKIKEVSLSPGLTIHPTTQ